MKTLFRDSLKECNIFSEELNLKYWLFSWNTYDCLLLLLLNQLLMIYCHYFEFSYALLVFITSTVKGSRCCSTRRASVWWGDSFSLGAHSQSLVLTGGRIGWASGRWQKQTKSVSGKLCPSWRVYIACSSWVGPRDTRLLPRPPIIVQLENMIQRTSA